MKTNKKKTKLHKFLSILSLSLSAFVLLPAFYGCFAKPEYVLQKVEEVDAQNESNISSWEEIPMVSQTLLDEGISGGEGAQWPLCIAGDNNDGNLMFYGTDVGGIFRSTDSGKTWLKSNTGLYSHGICDIEIDPNNENNVVAFGVNANKISYTTGIYTSEDAGQTWHFKQHFDIYGHRNVTESVAYDSSSFDKKTKKTQILYLSLIEKNDSNTSVLTDENKGLYKSSDAGQTWQRINKDLSDAIVKVDSNGYVFCANYNGLFVSFDKGQTFETLISDNVTGLDIVGKKVYFLVNSQPNDEGKETYAKLMTYEGGIISEISSLTGGTEEDPDGGNVHLIALWTPHSDSKDKPWQWHFVKGGGDKYYQYHFSTDAHKVQTVKVSPVNPNYMVIIFTNTKYWESASHTVLYSTDGGKTFFISTPNSMKTEEYGNHEDYNFLMTSNRRMDFYWSPVDENKIWDIENDWLSSSTDCGKTFYWDSNGINGIMCGGKFYFNLYDPNLMFFGSQDYCGAFTSDGGKSWTFASLTLNNPFNSNCNVYGGYAASKDVLFGVLAPRTVSDRYLAISYDGGKTVQYFYDESLKISSGYIRADGVSRMVEQAMYSSYQSPADKNILFCADLRSDDFGKTWSKMSGVTGVYAHDSQTNQLFGINDTLGEIVTSNDNGLSWQKVVSSTEIVPWWNNAYISDLAFDSTNKILYATCQWKAVFAIHLNENNKVYELSQNIPKQFSTDSEVGEDIIQNLGTDTYYSTRLTTVAVDPNNTDIIYVGGSNYKYRSDSSLFRSCDGGKTFYVINNNATNSIVKNGIQGGAEPLCIRVKPDTGDLWVAGNCLGFSKINAPYETNYSLSKSFHKVKIVDKVGNTGGYYYIFDKRKFVAKSDNEKLIFEGLYKDRKFKKPFNGVIEKDMTLYVKWQKS